jgi:SAM-dependent methyltransferase
MADHLPAYHFPSMAGLNVLDVGRASGFFSFEFEGHGANVTATEIAFFLDWDFVGGEPERQRRRAEIKDEATFTEQHITGAFNFAHAVRRSKVLKRNATIYDISPRSVGGPFDVVFAGSITSHLRDPILGFERLRSVTAPSGVCIVAAPCTNLREDAPLAAMVGTSDADRRSWWVLNKRCLVEMLRCAGFRDATIVGEFTLRLRRAVSTASTFPHIVAHARI